MKTKATFLAALLCISVFLSVLAGCQGTQEKSPPDEDRTPIVEPYKYHPKSNR